MVEPTSWRSFGIALTREPLPSRFATCFAVAHWPASLASPTSFITNPACFTACTPKDNVWTSVVNRVTKVRNVIVALCIVDVASFVSTTVISVVTCSTVKPHFKLVGTILGHFSTLGKEHLLGVVVCILTILLFAPIFTIAVPRWDIKTILHTQGFCSFSKVLRNIGLLRIGIAALAYVVFGRLCRPKAEAVVVFNDCNTALHTTSLNCFEPLTWIRYGRRCKSIRTFATVTPLFASVGVHSIVEESIKFSLVPLQLTSGRNGENGTRFVLRIGRNALVQSEIGRLCLKGSGHSRCKAESRKHDGDFFHNIVGLNYFYLRSELTGW